MIYQKTECDATTTPSFDLGAAIEANGVAVIPRKASGDSTFKTVTTTNLGSGKLVVDVCFATRAANQNTCPGQKTGVKT